MNRFGKLNVLHGGVDVNAIINSSWDQSDPVPQLYESKVPEIPLASSSSNMARPQYRYDGSDSEDDEIITSRGKRYHNTTTTSHKPQVFDATNHDKNNFPECQSELGQLASEGERFCPWTAVRKYPYAFVGVANRTRVAEEFFDQGKILDRTWDLFYIYRSKKELNQQPILLVPTKQFEGFLSFINSKLKTDLRIPSGGMTNAFQVTFENNGTPQPRYLGRCTSQDMNEELKNNIPPHYYKMEDEPPTQIPSDRSLASFQAKIALMVELQKLKKTANKKNSKEDRIEKQASWNHTIKRVQRYLGLRERHRGHLAAIRADVAASSSEWGAYDDAVQGATANLSSMLFRADIVAPFNQEDDVVFVCIDVEAWERNTKLITEIGIATLDTRDIKSVVPGEGGKIWMKHIIGRHFRMNEYKHLENTEFVAGCADRFAFGQSEFISIKDAPHVIASCFKHPFSHQETATIDGAQEPKRNIILVGHDVGADIAFLRTVGYDVHNLSTLQEVADTSIMWRYIKRESNSRSLGSILAELGIQGWNLHNAGNDAVYTLQAMLGIAIKHMDERQKPRKVKDHEKHLRVQEQIREAHELALDKEQGWSSAGENSDGGIPVPLAEPPFSKSKKITDSRPLDPKKSNNIYGRQSSYNQPQGSWDGPAKPAAYTAQGVNARLSQATSWRAPPSNSPRRHDDYKTPGAQLIALPSRASTLHQEPSEPPEAVRVTLSATAKPFVSAPLVPLTRHSMPYPEEENTATEPNHATTDNYEKFADALKNTSINEKPKTTVKSGKVDKYGWPIYHKE